MSIALGADHPLANGPGPAGLFGRIKAMDRITQLSWLAVAYVTVMTVYQRATFILQAHEPRSFVWSDMQGYVDRAWRLADPKVTLNRFDSFYPPGTHALMAPLFRLAGNKDTGLIYNEYLWFVLAVLTIWAVGGIAWKLFKHPAPVAIAMGGLLTHWPFTVFSGFYMSESPFSAFMAMALFIGLVARDMSTERRRWLRVLVFALSGTLAGCAATMRPQFFFGAITIGFPLLHRKFPFVQLREAVALGLMFILPCLGAMKLNENAAGVKVGMSGNAGFNFYQGHCDVVHVETHAKDGGGWYAFAAPVRIQRVNRENKPEKKVVVKDHMAWENDYFFAEGIKCAQAEGWAHLNRIYTNVEDLFSPADPWPPNTGRFGKASSWANHLYCHALFFVVPLVILLARYRRSERWLLLQLATVLPVGFIFYGDSRYRVPYDMFGFLMLAGLVAALLSLRNDERKIPGVGWRRVLPLSMR